MDESMLSCISRVLFAFPIFPCDRDSEGERRSERSDIGYSIFVVHICCVSPYPRMSNQNVCVSVQDLARRLHVGCTSVQVPLQVPTY